MQCLNRYLLSKQELILLWLRNYEFGEPLRDITNWVRFQAMDEFVQKLVMSKEKEPDELFRFRLKLDGMEEMDLREYLAKGKAFAVSYML